MIIIQLIVAFFNSETVKIVSKHNITASLSMLLLMFRRIKQQGKAKGSAKMLTLQSVSEL
jgi:ABC-type transport system involved in cytochrome c biogenesis permease subunit